MSYKLNLAPRLGAIFISLFACQFLFSVVSTVVYAADGCSVPSFRPAPFYKTGEAPRSTATGDFNGDGRADFVVANYGNDNVTVFINDGGGAFTVSKNFSVGGGPSSVATGDFNSDGKADIVTGNNTSGNVSILLGDGGGNFATASHFNAGVGMHGVTVGEFNGDGKSDLAVALEGSNRVAVLLGNGAGGFGAPTSFVLGTQQQFPRSIANGDLNGDGKADLVVGGGGSIQILLGNGTGTFTRVTTACTNNNSDSIVLVDMNGDGKLDLVGTRTSTTNVAVSRGTGTGCFEAATIYNVSPAPAAAHSPYAVAVADFNGDAMLDVATANGGSNNVSLLLGDGAGGLSASNVYGGGRFPRSLAAADFDGDGKADLATAFSEGGNLSVMFGSATSGFRFATGRGTVAALVADFNNDGKSDLAVTSGAFNSSGVIIMLGDGTGNFAGGKKFPAGNTSVSLSVADFNHDGKADVVVAGRGPFPAEVSGVFVLLGDGAGNLGAPAMFGVNANPFSVNVGDFNGDSHTDIVSANLSGNDISILFGNGQGGFGVAASFPAERFNNPQKIAVGDFNGDGKADLGLPTASGVTVLLNNGSGGFPHRVTFPAGSNTQSVITKDFNSDGKLDLAAANAGSGNVSLLLGDGAGGFGAAFNFPVGAGNPGSGPVDIVSGDFNLDGILDLATANIITPVGAVFYETSASMMLGNGTGGFAAPSFFPIGLSPWTINAGDLNADGMTDLLTANNSSDDISVLLNSCNAAPPPTSPALVEFGLGDYLVSENFARAAVTVTRSGNASDPLTVTLQTVDDPAAVPCDPTLKRPDGTSYPQGTAYARCDYATTIATVTFAAGDSQPKTVNVPLVDDAHVEGTETVQVKLLNPTGGVLGTRSTATLTIIDNDTTAGRPNPIFSTPFFVRMHYLDFLSREPEPGEPWSAILNGCANQFNTDPQSPSAACDRTIVSQSFFGAPEFRLKGLFVYNFYRVAFDRRPEYAEIIPDMSGVTGATSAEVYAKRAALPVSFTERAEFKARYDGLTDTAYVNALLDRYGLQQITTPDPQQPEAGVKVVLTRAELVSRLSAAAGTAQALTRAQVLRATVESDEVVAVEYKGAFVAMQYYGYLRRTPEESGYQAWLRVITEDPNNIRIMVNGFVNSTEYRIRFGRP
ncbi:MAG TPA: FG-GAP-like repeat-containing protein [Pyrinomonadaceae bacterium]